ncbi:hypothetical protein ElyMa_000754700 [Elysia marginata]|uniref:Uncharacterized protein n=1 Tax=Elysia marginata TaxID=1093978 RepID=A0AAV4GPL0_9GAST|nr:hypothetical protein ElyMa_000754700 [Elysia marginata]
MEHASAGKVDNIEAEAAPDSACPPPQCGDNKQGGAKEDFPTCHKVTGSQSSIDHDKTDTKRNAGHRSKSFLEEPVRSKAASFMQTKHGDTSNRSTHGSHGDGITQDSLASKGSPANENINRSGDQHKIFEVENSDIFTPTSAGSSQKLFDSEVTFADLVRVRTASSTKPEPNKAHVGNVLLSTPHAGTLVSNYLNSYRCYLAHLRHSGAVGPGLGDRAKPQPSTLSNVPLVLPLSRMTPVFTDDSHNDPEFIDLLKKTTTESIRNLWPCRGKTNIFSKAEYSSSAVDDPSKSQVSIEPVSTEKADTLSNSDLADVDETDGCSQRQDNYSTHFSDKDDANVSLCQNTLQDICQLLGADNVPTETLRDFGFDVTFSGETGELIYDLDHTDGPHKKDISPRVKPNKEMVKTLTDNVQSFSNSVPSCQIQTNSNCWSDVAQDSDCDSKLSHYKSSHLNKLLQLQLQQKLAHQQQLQRQLIHQQRHQQQQLQQQQQQNQIYSDQQLFQQFQGEKLSHEGVLQQYQHLEQSQQQQQQQQQQHQNQQQQEHQLDALKLEKKQFSAEAKPWYQITTDGSHRTSITKAVLNTSTQLTTVHASKVDADATLPAGIGGFDRTKKKPVSGQRFYTGADMAGFPQSGSATITSQQSVDTPSQLRTLKASYACLDPHQSNSVLPTDQLFDSLREESSVKLSKDLSGDQPFSAEPFGEVGLTLTSEDSNASCRKSWPNLNHHGVSVISANDGSNGKHNVPETRWGRNTETSVQERLKRAYARTLTGDFNHAGAWTTGFSTDRSQQLGSFKSGHDETFGSGLDSQGLTFHDQNMFYDSLDSSLGVGGVLGFAKSNNAWPQLEEASGTFDGFEYSTDDCHGRSQGLTSLDQSSRLSRLYQWRTEPDTLRGPGCELSAAPTSCSGALVTTSQADRDFSWNASSVAPQLDQPESFHNEAACRSMQSSAMGDMSSLFADRDSSVEFDRKLQAGGMEAGGPAVFENFRCSGPDMSRGGIFQQQTLTSKHQQQHPWANNGTQSDTINMKTAGNPSLSYDPFLSHSMQVLNNKILSAQNATCMENETEARSTSGPDNNLVCLNHDFGVTANVSSNDHVGSDSLTMSHQTMSSQHHQKLQQQQQHSKQNSAVPLSDQLEKTYLHDGLVSKPWHELANDDQSASDIQSSVNRNKQIGRHLGQQESTTTYTTQAQGKDKCSNNNSDGTALKDQGRQVTSHRPRLILGANNMQTQKRETTQTDNLEESNRRLREMLGLSHNADAMGKPAGKSLHLQENVVSQAQLSSGMIVNSAVPAHLMTNASMNGSGTRLQIPNASMQSTQAINPQMYCVPNILMPPPQAQTQTPNTSRPSGMVLSSMASSARFPGMIRLPYVDMSRVVYIQQMPVNVSSSQSTNNNHNNSTSSNPHVNVSNIITINTDKDFSNSGLPDKPARLVRQNMNKNKPTFFKVRSGSEEYSVPILGMRTSVDDRGCTRQIKPRTNPWDQDLDQDFNSSLLSKAKAVEQVAGLPNIPTVAECVGATGEQSKSAGLGPVMGAVAATTGAGSAGATTGADPNLQMATFMQWPASADMHPEMLDMLPVRRAGPEDCGMGGRVCWPDMEFMLTSRDQLQNARRSNKPMGSNKANLISIIPRGASVDSQGNGAGQKDLDLS